MGKSDEYVDDFMARVSKRLWGKTDAFGKTRPLSRDEANDRTAKVMMGLKLSEAEKARKEKKARLEAFADAVHAKLRMFDSLDEVSSAFAKASFLVKDKATKDLEKKKKEAKIAEKKKNAKKSKRLSSWTKTKRHSHLYAPH